MPRFFAIVELEPQKGEGQNLHRIIKTNFSAGFKSFFSNRKLYALTNGRDVFSF